MADKFITIIIVNFNGRNFLKECLDSLQTLEYKNFEIVLTDNNSSDESVGFVRKNYPQVKIIENRENLGFALANNQAVINAKGEYLFFLNNDTKVHPKVLEFLATKMEGDNSIGICGCKIMSYDGKTLFHSGIGVDIFGYPIAEGELFYVEGSALMIRKNLFERIEGFDFSYFMFHEDIDLAWRVWLIGYKIVTVPEAIIYHFAGASAGGGMMSEGKYRSTFFRRYLSERNNIRTLLKNYGFPILPFILIAYFLINLAEMVFFLVFLKPKVIFCYLKAYFWNIVHFNEVLRARKKIQDSRKVSDSEILRKMYKGIGKLLALKKVNIPSFG